MLLLIDDDGFIQSNERSNLPVDRYVLRVWYLMPKGGGCRLHEQVTVDDVRNSNKIHDSEKQAKKR